MISDHFNVEPELWKWQLQAHSLPSYEFGILCAPDAENCADSVAKWLDAAILVTERLGETLGSAMHVKGAYGVVGPSGEAFSRQRITGWIRKRISTRSLHLLDVELTAGDREPSANIRIMDYGWNEETFDPNGMIHGSILVKFETYEALIDANVNDTVTAFCQSLRIIRCRHGYITLDYGSGWKSPYDSVVAEAHRVSTSEKPVRGYYWGNIMRSVDLSKVGGIAALGESIRIEATPIQGDDEMVFVRFAKSILEVGDSELRALRDALAPLLPGFPYTLITIGLYRVHPL